MEHYDVSDEEKVNILAKFGKTRKDVAKDVDALQKWWKTQMNLPLDFKDNYFIEIMLLRSKFDVEKAKIRIENFFKYTRMYPEVFCQLGKFKVSERDGGVVTMTKLTSDFERINIFKFIVDNPEDLKVEELMHTLFTIGTIMYLKDYEGYLRVVVDFTGFKYDFLTRLTPMIIYKIYRIIQKIVKARISGIDLINAPPFISSLLSIIKITIKPKLFSRITVHKNLESLHESISPEYLPEEYGGRQESIKDLLQIMDKVIQDEDKLFEKMSNLFMDIQSDPTFGIQGTFKSLNLD